MRRGLELLFVCAEWKMHLHVRRRSEIKWRVRHGHCAFFRQTRAVKRHAKGFRVQISRQAERIFVQVVVARSVEDVVWLVSAKAVQRRRLISDDRITVAHEGHRRVAGANHGGGINRQEGAGIGSAKVGGSHHGASRTMVEKARGTKVARRVERGGRHWACQSAKVYAEARGRVDAEVRSYGTGSSKIAVMLWDRCEKILRLKLHWLRRFVFNEERRHWVVAEHVEVDGGRHGTTALPLVATGSGRAHKSYGRVLEDARVWVHEVVRLTSWPEANGSDRGRSSNERGRIMQIVAVLKRVEGDKLCELSAECF